jgi:hypothetical protein
MYKKTEEPKKFRHARIEPSLHGELDMMFNNLVATRQYAWAPSSRMLYGDDGRDGGLKNTNVDRDANLEGRGDSDEDSIYNFEDIMSNMVVECNVVNSSSKRSSDKRKARQQYTHQCANKKEKGFENGSIIIFTFG